MKKIKQALNTIYGGLKSAWQWAWSAKGRAFIESAADQVTRIVSSPKFLELAEELAKLTPTRTDDEIVAAARKFEVEHAFVPGMVASDALHIILRELLRKFLPSTSDFVLNMAAEGLALAVKGKTL